VGVGGKKRPRSCPFVKASRKNSGVYNNGRGGVVIFTFFLLPFLLQSKYLNCVQRTWSSTDVAYLCVQVSLEGRGEGKKGGGEGHYLFIPTHSHLVFVLCPKSPPTIKIWGGKSNRKERKGKGMLQEPSLSHCLCGLSCWRH